MSLRTVDLYCGGGGSSWGARSAGAEIVCGVDAWKRATEVFESNFGVGTARNLMLSDSSRARDLGDVGRIDLLLASPECTNHTCARGNRPLDEESRRTASHVVRFAEDLNPRWIVVENVIQMRSWAGYEEFLSGLRALGYHLLVQVLNSSDVGVPQTRRRLFVIGDKERPPRPMLTLQGSTRGAASVLDPDGTWPSRPLRRPGRAAPTLARAERAISELGPGQPFLIVYYGSDGSGGWQTLNKPLRTLTTLDRFGLVTWQGGEPMLRMLQVPELKRAMGFPPDYKLLGSRREQIKVLGNGVTPPLMRELVLSLTGGTRLTTQSRTSMAPGEAAAG